MRTKLHSSWLIGLGCALFVCGVSLAPMYRAEWWVGLVAVSIVTILGLLRYVYAVPIFAVACMYVGLGYGSAHVTHRGLYEGYVGRVVTLEGTIKEDPSKSPSGSISLQLHAIKINQVDLPGAVYVSARKADGIKRGDIITISGQAKEGFGNFPISLSVPAPSSVVRPVPGDVGRVVRDWFADNVRQYVPEPQASLGIGFLTGQKSALPEDLSEALKIAGLTHIVVASGYNLTILVRMARRLFVKISKFLSAVSSGLMITMFMAVTGLSPSMTRAGLVSGLSLMAWYYGHKLHPFILLPFAAAITVALNPSYVWGDLGWQLSFAAFTGVMLLAPLLQCYFFGQKEPGVLRQILGETIAAHAVTVPIIALSFGTVSHVAIIANLLVVPLVPLAMLLTFICGLWAIIGLPFAWVVAVPTDWLLTYMVRVATFVSELEWAQSAVQLSGWVWVGYVAVLTIAWAWMWRSTRFSFRRVNPIV